MKLIAPPAPELPPRSGLGQQAEARRYNATRLGVFSETTSGISLIQPPAFLGEAIVHAEFGRQAERR